MGFFDVWKQIQSPKGQREIGRNMLQNKTLTGKPMYTDTSQKRLNNLKCQVSNIRTTQTIEYEIEELKKKLETTISKNEAALLKDKLLKLYEELSDMQKMQNQQKNKDLTKNR